MELLDMLEVLCKAQGVSGTEHAAAEAAKTFLSPIGVCETTPLGGVVCRVKDAGPNKPHLLLTAHLDQVGLIVTYIDDKGFLRVGSVGGLDAGILPAVQVLVHTDAGVLPGVVCTVPPHLQKDDKNPAPPVTEAAIDVGLSKEECEKVVSLGDRITFAVEPVRLLSDRFASAAVDDRAGCVCVIAAAQGLAAEPLDCSLTVLLSAMEETGGQGSAVGTFAAAPTHAIAVDVSFAYRKGLLRHQCGAFGEGVMVGCAPILDRVMYKSLCDTASANGIAFQPEIMGGKTGTDADNVAIAGTGVRTALLSIPLQNMHTPSEVICQSDLAATVDLMTAWTKSQFGGEA